MSDKTHPPSEQRKRHAREHGEFGLSQELSKLLLWTIGTEAVLAAEPAWRTLLQNDMLQALAAIARPGRVPLDSAWSAFSAAVLIMLCMAGVAALVSALAVLSQTGFNIAPKALEKGTQRFDIGSNLKQLVAPKKFLMALLGPLKMSVLLATGYGCLRDQLPGLAQLYVLTPQQGWLAAMAAMRTVTHHCLGVLLVLVLADLALQRYMNYRSMMMDISEVKRDHKESEGDPHTKGQRKGIAKQNVMEERRSPRAPEADAVVVNPEHIAVALAYSAERDGLPRIVDKGRDGEADQLRALARQRHVPIIKYPGLARQLYATGRVGSHIPSHTLRAVALLYRAIQELEGMAVDELHEIDEEIGHAMLAGPVPPPPQSSST
ncbi:EscU/YscU/HrcU family type III secretion system export apparatus switch protein [Pseudoduganella sp. R-34]|uniref:EscU/YscU/HrcU family type III secretion system export apparatus switch protein n=1 Tax=Pseudoduganella sp. R-34 TaxID=3404062 RepID=UPI003CEDF614